MPKEHLTDLCFESFDLPEALQKGLEKAGFIHCTPIQAKTLPLALSGQDVAGQAQTGTGKTAAFLVAMFKRLMTRKEAPDHRPNQPRALIIAPTRELAIQIHQEAQILASETSLKLGLAYGGLRLSQQRKQLAEGIDVLVGTPGRLIDCQKQQWLDLAAVEVIVLDEADRMFDLGFIKQIRFLLRRLPPATERLNLMFSATLSWRVTELAYEHMNHPHLVKIKQEQVTASKVIEAAYYVGNDEKIPLLLGLLKELEPPRAIVFVNTKRSAERLADYLTANDRKCGVLSGDVPQPKRLSLLKAFQNGDIPVLVATDVAARGLHIPEVSHVFNFDLPQDAEEYVHRIGRTARIGAEGMAISFACEEYSYSLPDIERYVGHSIAAEAVTESLLVTPKPPAKSQRRKPPSRKHATRSTRGQRKDGKKKHTRPKNNKNKRPS